MNAGWKAAFATAVVVTLLSAQGSAAQDTGEGFQLAAACASCHGRSGGDQGIPKIAGLNENKIVEKIMAYRASESPSHVMHAIGLSLSDEELASVARYLAAHGED